jgi:hypothetical protein
MEKKPKKKSTVHRAAMCVCFCAIHAYTMHASMRNNAAGFVLSKRIYRCVYVSLFVRQELKGRVDGIQK